MRNCLRSLKLDAFLGSQRTVDLWGRNGPILQFAGKSQKLQLGPAELEFGIQVGCVLIVGVEFGILLVAEVGLPRMFDALRALKFAARMSHRLTYLDAAAGYATSTRRILGFLHSGNMGGLEWGSPRGCCRHFISYSRCACFLSWDARRTSQCGARSILR